MLQPRLNASIFPVFIRIHSYNIIRFYSNPHLLTRNVIVSNASYYTLQRWTFQIDDRNNRDIIRRYMRIISGRTMAMELCTGKEEKENGKEIIFENQKYLEISCLWFWAAGNFLTGRCSISESHPRILSALPRNKVCGQNRESTGDKRFLRISGERLFFGFAFVPSGKRIWNARVHIG